MLLEVVLLGEDFGAHVAVEHLRRVVGSLVFPEFTLGIEVFPTHGAEEIIIQVKNRIRSFR